MSDSSPRRLRALTSFRFIAAAMVVVAHSAGAFGLPKDLGFSEHLAGGQAVSFFFVLSGFILTYAYPELPTAADRGRFLLARFARLWPAHVACTVALFALTGWPEWTWPNLGIALAQLTMTHAWLPLHGVNVSWNLPSWSISTEFFFYLSFVVLIRRWEQTWLRKLVVSLTLLAAMLLLCWLDPFGDGSPRRAECRFVYVHPFARLFEFTLGMTASLGWRRLSSRVHPGRVFGTAAEMAAVALVALNYRTIAAQLPWLGKRVWFQQAESCFSFAILITVFAAEWGWLSRVLSLPTFTLLGEISYGVYLLHFPLLAAVGLHAEQIARFPTWMSYGAFWLVLLLACLLLWLVYERPARSFLVGLWPKRYYRRRPVLVVATA